MDLWVDGCMGGRMDVWVDGCMGGRMYRSMDRGMCEWVDMDG